MEEMARLFEQEKAKRGQGAAAVHSDNVVNKRQAPQESKKPKSSIFAQKRQKEMEARFHLPEEPMETASEEPAELLLDIVEKNLSCPVVRAPRMPETSSSQRHFPDLVPVRELQQEAERGRDGRSIFARQFQEVAAERGRGRKVDTGQLGERSRLLSGQGESRSLHQENLATLAAMTEAEVLEEQQKLLAAMDPSLVDWIRARKAETKDKTPDLGNTGGEKESSKNTTIAKTVAATMVGDHDKVEVKTHPLAALSCLPDYPGMSVVEEEKLSWTGDLPPLPTSNLGQFSARFGLDGALLAPDLDVPVQVQYNIV